MQQSDFILLSIGFLAQEIENNQNKDKPEDVWSLGVIWYYMFTGEIIIKDSNSQLQLQNIDQQIEENRIDQNIKNLLKQMLVIESQNRITFDQLIQQLRQVYSNKTNFNFQNLQYSFNDQINLKNLNRQQDLENLQNQFTQELSLYLEIKQTSIKKAMIDIIQEVINQNFFLLQDFNNDKQELYINQKCDIQVQCNQNNLNKWERTDTLFLQIHKQFQVYINELIQSQKDQIEQRRLEKEQQINREISWQIKQQILLEQILLQENQNSDTFQSFKLKIINNTQNQLNILNEYLDNSIISIQRQQRYVEFKKILTLIQQDINQQRYENIIELQKQLIHITIKVDSLEKEVELEQLDNKLQRDKITIINKSKNLIKEYSAIVDNEIIILEELKQRNLLLMRQNQQGHYFDDKIKTLSIQKLNLILEEQQLSQVLPKQQIETILLLIQKIKFFNEKINKFINFQKQELKQFQSELQILQISNQNNLQKELTDLINQFTDQLDIMDTYFYVGEICCKDINVFNQQYESKNDLLKILNKQSYQLQECQEKLQLNNLIIESNLSNFAYRDFFKQSCSKVYQQTLENFTFKIQQIINLKEQVRNRLLFYGDEDFLKEIIVSWNEIKCQKEKLQNMLEDIKETYLTNQMNKDILQEQISKIKGLIIQIKLQHQIKPSFAQIQRFNKEYIQNQINYLELFTLVVYIKQYYNSIFLNIYLSLKSNILEKLNLQSQIQSQLVINKIKEIKSQIEQSKQKQSQVHIIMQEYLKCLQKKSQTFEIDKLQQDNNTITQQNLILENEIIQIIKVKLHGQKNDKQLINDLIKQQKIFEISALFYCYNLAIE